MKNSKILKTVLVLTGVVAMIVGGANLIVPIAFNASSGIDLGGDISLINEMRATGGSVFLIGVVIFLGAFMSKLRYTSTLLATIVYLGYGFSRLLSIMIDGKPSDDLVSVAIFEIIIGLISLFCLYKYKLN